MNIFQKLAHMVMKWCQSPQAKKLEAEAQTALSEAQAAASGALAVCAVLGEPASVTAEISKIADGLAASRAAIAAAGTANTFTQEAQNLAALTTKLVTSGDIGVENQATQAAVQAMAQKVAGVVGVLETTAAAQTPAASAPAPAPATT